MSQITITNKEIGRQTLAHLNNLTKPIGSLGRLEELAVQIAEITDEPFPNVSPPVSIVFAADHGIALEGVSAYPQEVTAQMAANFLSGGAGINVLTNQIKGQFVLVDIGIASELKGSGYINEKIRYGTANFAKESAMTKGQAVKAIEAGIKVTTNAISNGANSVILGEMGIGNTTSSSAILAILSGEAVENVVGPGTGISEEKLLNKQQVIKKALMDRNPDPNDVLDILSKVGGLEIAGMTGAILGAASKKTPLIIDGFISTVSAVLAIRLAPNVRNYLIFSHQSQEAGHGIALKMLEAKPLLDLELRLGEGTGAALAFPLVQSSVHVLKEMATFTGAGISITEKSEDLEN
ncbi:nicotinate-nucleotide--dimethylbenzimidazole phosphoribosyltransferase [Salipaludibacillus keqinensis]|uniref:Nicotinate-nucleotide--dimethylbenzimidazole phosphoribosyltransferase n=1 Tax=Salipaludibacillus keqinensis TaxID=2045207 RepID=A0A323TAT4_9BACI|nr:nicotinate-nucleotide--dimethylbenzimidazole phosphoribosyltransferase [Salipaludibacillus keqinensis]PYZ92451.1 nicotinate-nucleotide--dimethylbenzimidazole phosphoribosyltransferase [Salipaludibacillus keqinensis]